MVGNGWHRYATAALCASIVGLAACSGRNGNGSASDSATATSSTGDVAKADSAATAATPGAGTAGATGTASATGMMSITGGDAELLQVLAVVDQGEIQDGQLAQRQARNAQVKSYARELVADHTKSLSQDKQLAKTANVDLSNVIKSGAGTTGAAGSTGGATGVAAQLQTMHTQTMDQVKQANGAAFDSAFVTAQVTGHQQVLDLLQRSQSQAQNSGVQQHLAAAIRSVQEHLDRGQKLQQSLAGGTSGTGTRGDSASKSKTGSDTGRRG